MNFDQAIQNFLDSTPGIVIGNLLPVIFLWVTPALLVWLLSWPLWVYSAITFIVGMACFVLPFVAISKSGSCSSSEAWGMGMLYMYIAAAGASCFVPALGTFLYTLF